MKKKFLISLFIFLALLIFILRPYYLILKNTLKISPLRTLLSWDSIRKVNNQTNILILGIAGGTHEGPTLSDSIVVANYDFTSNKLVTLGIPRDVWSPTLEDKVNSAYAFGEAKQKGGGLKLAKAEVASVIGMPIQYAVVINFQGFEKLINYLGGIDVDVEHSFIDKKYPLEGKEEDTCGGDKEFSCRYETISFNKGMTHMDGSIALKFVRSRNAIDEEGSDFARSQRQQKVFFAVKDKVTKIIRSLNTIRIEELYQYIDPIISRDISNQQAAIIAKSIIFGSDFKQENYALPRNFFIIPSVDSYGGQYVLIPKNNDYKTIRQYSACIFSAVNKKDCDFLID